MGFFDRFREERVPLVDQAYADVKLMLANGHVMFVSAAAHLYDNEILDIDMEALDLEVKRCEQHLRRAVLEHLALDPSQRLVFCLKLLSIVTEAERVGDLAQSLVRVAKMAARPRLGPALTPLRAMRDEVIEMFGFVERGFLTEDQRVARAHMLKHEAFKRKVNAYLVDLAHSEDPTLNEGITHALSARMMSRVSSHLANIASTIVLPFDQIRNATTAVLTPSSPPPA